MSYVRRMRHDHWEYRERNIPDQEYFTPRIEKDLHSNLHLDGPFDIVACASYRMTFYAVVSLENGLTACICPYHWMPSGYDNFEYSIYWERDDYPYKIACPLRLLDPLSPVEELFPDNIRSQEKATSWRTRCRERAAKLAAKPRVRSGDIVVFARQLTSTEGQPLKDLVFDSGSSFHPLADPYSHYHIRKWRERDWTVIPHEELEQESESIGLAVTSLLDELGD